MICSRCGKQRARFMRAMKAVFIVSMGSAYDDGKVPPEPYVIEFLQEVRICTPCISQGAAQELIETVRLRSRVPSTHTKGIIEWGAANLI